MKQKLIVVSVDAMTGEELGLLLTLPNARRFSRGARAARIRSVYPTLTYPCHAAMLTGCYPERTGIVSNSVFAPGVSPVPWHWAREDCRAEDDLLFAGKRAGLATASVFWPGTGRHPAVDFLIPEYWPQGPGDTLTDAMARMGSQPAVLEVLRRHPCGNLAAHPEADAFAAACACDILRTFRPDVLLLHPANLDEAKHLHGTRGPHIEQALREADEWIGALWDAVRGNGDGAVTNFVLTSDHGQLDVVRVFSPNALLREAGLIRTDGQGRLSAWDAFCMPGGMCFEVRLRDPDDAALRERVRALLEGWRTYGVTRVMTPEETRPERLSGEFAFFCEMDGQTAVRGALFGEPLRPRGAGDPAATHGYLPDRGPQPAFLCWGPAFREDACIREANLVDEAPTLAAALGLPLTGAQGRALTELLA